MNYLWWQTLQQLTKLVRQKLISFLWCICNGSWMSLYQYSPWPLSFLFGPSYPLGPSHPRRPIYSPFTPLVSHPSGLVHRLPSHNPLAFLTSRFLLAPHLLVPYPTWSLIILTTYWSLYPSWLITVSVSSYSSLSSHQSLSLAPDTIHKSSPSPLFLHNPFASLTDDPSDPS